VNPRRSMGEIVGEISHIGAIFAASPLGIVNVHKPSEHRLHALAIVMINVTAFLLVFSIFDRTLP
jgi:hypothetical protein